MITIVSVLKELKAIGVENYEVRINNEVDADCFFSGLTKKTESERLRQENERLHYRVECLLDELAQSRKALRQQQKGLNRLSRKVKRLQAKAAKSV